jgi:hypothetical protein
MGFGPLEEGFLAPSWWQHFLPPPGLYLISSLRAKGEASRGMKTRREINF